MIRSIRYLPICLLTFIFILSCSTYSESWIVPSQSELPSICIGEVLVDRASGWTSIEREIRDMVPLLFSEYEYPFVLDNAGADYVIDVQSVEREYMSGWRSERSIAVEIRVYKNSGMEDYRNAVPLIVGKTTSSGNASLASSQDLRRLLNAGVKKIVKSYGTLQKENAAYREL